MKQRFSSLDVKVIAHELSASLCSLRVSNIYDLSSRIFLFKFAKPDHRQQLIVDSGFRCHLTSFARTAATTPSVFVSRLRKYLKTRRVTAVGQIGTDRIIDIQFSDGQYRLFLEFYAGGNIVLTDKDLSILAALRVTGEGQDEIRIGVKYSLENRQNYGGVPPITKERVSTCLSEAPTKTQDTRQTGGKKTNQKNDKALRKILTTAFPEFPPMLMEHALQSVDMEMTAKPEDIVQNDVLLEKLMTAFKLAQEIIESATSSEVCQGFILSKPRKGALSDASEPLDASSSKPILVYDDFQPFRPKQFESEQSGNVLSFDGYNKTVDEFFSSIEAQKLEGRLADREEHAKKKLEAARKDHERRIGGLQEVQELNIRKAQAIEANVERVEEATAAINGLIAQGMDWVEIARLIEMEKERGNPVAELIKLPLKLYENTATLLLSELGSNEEDDFEGDSTDEEVSESDEESEKQELPAKAKTTSDLQIDINLGLSPWANAREYYDQRRSAVAKEQKTQQSSSKALKSTEKKITADLKKGLKTEKAVLRPVRHQFWFEKFWFFMSSDGYLVLGGKDARQSEIIYRKHFHRGDVYVHAELPGAASIFIKNKPNTPEAPIPPSTLSQAGTLSIATSTAWDNKSIMSAWWVKADQVSKIASTGDHLAVGTFSITGTKNFLPPTQLVLGFGVLFEINEESKSRHNKHRLTNAGGSSSKGANVEDDRLILAEMEAAAENINIDSDEEDFPDAKLDSESDSEDEMGESNLRADQGNPLQSSQPQRAANTHDTATEEDKKTVDEGSHVEEPLPTDGDGDEALNADTKTEDEDDVEDEEPDPIRTEPEREDELYDPNSSTQANGTKEDSQRPASRAGPPKRGKRAKQKKLAKKYADQDDEDRELAMKLLGSAAAKAKAEAEAEAKLAKEKELAFQKERRKEQHQRAAKKARDHEEARLLAGVKDGEGSDGEEEDSSAAVDLECFIGTPLPGDQLISAIPVCAPWTAMANYKYRAKMQPGTQKKSRAIKDILGAWTVSGDNRKRAVDEKSEDVEKIWPQETELIRNWKDTELINTVPVSKVRVMISGGASWRGAPAKGTARGRKPAKK